MVDRMKLKVRGGTVSDAGKNLCESCRSSVVVRGAAVGQKIIACRALDDKIVPFDVKECNAYDDSRTPTLSAMRQIAWDLTDKGGRKAGFRPPDKGDGPQPLLTPDGDVYW